MGLKEQAPPVSLRHFEDERKQFRRSSMSTRDPRDTLNTNAPLAKRQKLLHPQDR